MVRVPQGEGATRILPAGGMSKDTEVSHRQEARVGQEVTLQVQEKRKGARRVLTNIKAEEQVPPLPPQDQGQDLLGHILRRAEAH